MMIFISQKVGQQFGFHSFKKMGFQANYHEGTTMKDQGA
jgi:hypothetical protein